jgi:predicted Zn-ribbon and HTH transcriptional regulator
MRHCTDCDLSIPGWHRLEEKVAKSCLCTDCCSIFAICGFSDREFSPGDMSQLCRIRNKVRKNQKMTVETGIEIMAIPSPEANGFITWDLSNTLCPSCQTKTMTLSLPIGSDCPKCKTGKIQDDDTWIDP